MPRVEAAYEYKRRRLGPVAYMFRCPGCDELHQFYVRQATRPPEDNPAWAFNPVWTFNGDVERPTFSPSLLVRWEHGPDREQHVCHSFVRAGRIQFLNDCTHALAGQTVDLPECSAESDREGTDDGDT